MLEFKPILPSDRTLYEKYLADSERRGCEYSFLNVFLWGEQQLCETEGCLILLSRFGDYTAYSYPLGKGDIKSALEKIIEDSRKRGILCRLNGVMPKEKAFIEAAFPDTFSFSTNRDTYDYIYDIEALSTLAGKKYHSKRNFINRFYENYPDAVTEPLNAENVLLAKKMAEDWFSEKEALLGKDTFALEREAITRLAENFAELSPEGLILKNGDELLAFTVGTPFYDDTFDVHFEKALRDTDGAYPLINREFARHIKEKYPHVKFLDREEDMGLEGLRKAKESYRPVNLVEKWRAKL